MISLNNHFIWYEASEGGLRKLMIRIVI